MKETPDHVVPDGDPFRELGGVKKKRGTYLNNVLSVDGS